MSRMHYGPIDQIGLIVENLDASIRHWSELGGLGPWTVFRNVSLDGDFRGQQVTITMDVAMAYQDQVQIELIQATNLTPSPYRDAAGKPLLGMHHVAWLTDDLDKEMDKAMNNGLRPVFRAQNAAVRVAYCEAENEPGILFEFIEGESTRQLFVEGRIAARDWDGTNPIHEIDFAAS